MLTSLRITNLGVISEATLEPAAGLTAITGETGAGKTMIVSGLGALLGTKTDTTRIRNGASKALVEGNFEVEKIAERLTELGVEIEQGEALFSRQLNASGRSRAFIGGVQIPLATLASLAGDLATLHGQSGQIRLASSQAQREVLDHEHPEILNAYRECFLRHQKLAAQLEQLKKDAKARARQHDLLVFGLEQIEKVNPRINEDVELTEYAAKLQAIDELRQLSASASYALSGSDEGDQDDLGAVGLVGRAKKWLNQISDLDANAKQIAQTCQELSSTLNELAVEVASYLANLEADPAELENTNFRLSQLQDLKRKYGDDLNQVLTWAKEAAEQVAELSDDEEKITQLTQTLADLERQIAEKGNTLTKARLKVAKNLEKLATTELKALAMPNSQLRFEIKPAKQASSHGLDDVQLVFSANLGTTPAPLSKVASGGELSRVRLALEVVLAADDPGHVFVFDEVDSGIGGTVATQVGLRLASLAKHSQVIVVTHLAQVAAFADTHYQIVKSNDGNITTSNLKKLTQPERVAELARMMGGVSNSSTGLAHAQEMIDQALTLKNS